MSFDQLRERETFGPDRPPDSNDFWKTLDQLRQRGHYEEEEGVPLVEDSGSPTERIVNRCVAGAIVAFLGVPATFVTEDVSYMISSWAAGNFVAASGAIPEGTIGRACTRVADKSRQVVGSLRQRQSCLDWDLLPPEVEFDIPEGTVSVRQDSGVSETLLVPGDKIEPGSRRSVFEPPVGVVSGDKEKLLTLDETDNSLRFLVTLNC